VTPFIESFIAGTYDGHRLTQAYLLVGNINGRAILWGYNKFDRNTNQGDNNFSLGWGHRIHYQTNNPGMSPLYEGGGSGTMMTIAQQSINVASDNKTLYRPTQFAVHRQAEGLREKPYIRMRRKVHRHPQGMSTYAVPINFETPNYNGSYAPCHGWDEIFDSKLSNGPQGETANGTGDSTSYQYNYWFSNYLSYDAWRWWCKSPGNAGEGYDGWDEWEIDCNFATKDQINKLVGYDEEIDKGAENMFFEIAVL
jgi:hypothetical protein